MAGMIIDYLTSVFDLR